MDPVTALATATSAFKVIKKGFEVGRDLESMYKDVGRWMGAVSDISHAESLAKNPPLFKKIFAGSSVEEEALNAFAAKKKAQSMEDELRSYINLAYGPDSWNELLRMQAEIRKRRQKMIYEQQLKQRKILEWSLMFIIIFIGGFILLLILSKILR
jgi:hypothetical protein